MAFLNILHYWNRYSILSFFTYVSRHKEKYQIFNILLFKYIFVEDKEEEDFKDARERKPGWIVNCTVVPVIKLIVTVFRSIPQHRPPTRNVWIAEETTTASDRSSSILIRR